MQQHLIIDCDPGHDDYVMLLMACGSPNVHIRCISTVFGNAMVENTTKNALIALELAKTRGIPVVMGAAGPILGGRALTCPEIHGESGLAIGAGIVLPQPSEQPHRCDNYLLFMRNLIIDAPEPTTIVATGCLTNVALLLLAFPEVKSKLKIHIMGGAGGDGNVSPDGEFNIICDPLAASIVFNSGVDVFMVTLEITHQNLVTKARLNQLTDAVGANEPFAVILRGLLTYFADTYAREFEMPDPPLHDPLALFSTLAPELFKFKKLFVAVETNTAAVCVGRTSIDRFARSNKEPNVWVCQAADIDAFWRALCDAVATVSKRW